MKFAENLARFIVNARWYMFALFLALAVGSVFVMPYVGINYDLTKYLPGDSNTKIAIDVMTEEFGGSGNASIMIDGITEDKIDIVYELQSRIEKVNNVASVVFTKTENDYKDNKALLKVFFETGNFTQEVEVALNSIKDICADQQAYYAGAAVESTESRTSVGSEMYIILAVAIAIVLLILLLTSHSWLEPLVYLMVIGVSILMNMGTNIALGEISFVTRSISAIMLIALIMDYCIILCSRYREESAKGLDAKEAMVKALTGSFKAVIACACTVMIGLLALVFMKFSIGFDMGMVLAKGVAISIFAVLFFMPAVILMLDKALKRTEHKFFLPKMDKIGSFAHKTRWIMPIVFLCLVVAGIVIQNNITFNYVANSVKETSQVGQDAIKVEETFGKQNALVIILPSGQIEKEKALLYSISNIEVDGVKYINSASGIAGTALYEKGNAEQFASQFGLNTADVAQIFVAMGHTATDEIYTIELLEYLHTDFVKTDSTIKQMFAAKQAQIDNIYNGLTAQLNYMESIGLLHNNYQIDITEAQMKQIYAGIASIDVADVDENVKVPVYAVMGAVYQGGQAINPNPYAGTQFENVVLYQILGELTPAQIKQIYGLPDNAIQMIFVANGKNPATDTLQAIRLIGTVSTQKVINTICTTIEAKVNYSYSQALFAQSMYTSDNYSRLIFNINLDVDDEKAVVVIEKVHEILNSDAYSTYEAKYIVNNTENMIETKEIFSTDRIRVDLIIILGVFLLILLMFRSVSIPVLLVLTIQGSIWINLAISVVAGNVVFFICYLLGMAIQMGATIDYGILLTDRYTGFRKTMNRKEAMQKALNVSFPTIITSGSILIVAAFTIHFISSTPILSEIGALVGRGALVSVIAVIFVLPQLLILFDKVMEKTTLKQKYFSEKALVVEAENVSTNTEEENTKDVNAVAPEVVEQHQEEKPEQEPKGKTPKDSKTKAKTEKYNKKVSKIAKNKSKKAKSINRF